MLTFTSRCISSQSALVGSYLCTPAISFHRGERTFPTIKPYEAIPGPKPLPLIGNLWRYTPFIGQYSFSKIHRTYEKMNRQYGPLVREKVFGNRDLLHAFHPEDIKLVYFNDNEHPTRHTHQALVKYRKDRPDIYSTIGVFLSNGEEWERNRKHFSPMMLLEDIDRVYSAILEEVTDDFVDLIPKILNRKSEVELQTWLYKWAVESFVAVALDIRYGCFTENDGRVRDFVKAAHDTHKCVYITEVSPIYKYFKTRSYKKLEEAQNHVAKVVNQHIREKKLSKRSLIQRMLEVESATEKEVFVMALDMFLAGIDTMSYTTAFAFYNLAKNTNVQDKLRFLLRKELADKDYSLTDKMNSGKVEYLESVVKETLRLNPVAFGNGRILTTDLVLSGYLVPEGTQVILQHQAASKNPDYFHSPDTFLPERFEKHNWSQNMFHPVAYAPFGFGGRGCLGKKIAQRQMALVLGKMVEKYRITYHYKDIDAVCRLVNVPDKPLVLRFHKVDT